MMVKNEFDDWINTFSYDEEKILQNRTKDK